ncbi:superfamily II DNA or RNA helicase [Acinetobacter sp. BIGb0102]|uniref:DEAD/DEAH box helicase n=1 Tax=Acinetobacter sp. BIGb0102 TaxID=2485131 RepID=UPI000F510E64|nr:DEAD/DEAH box helicase family protein [Acinetobacter sp. BIGb0102]RPE31427.1 superfamily II DNA or RNA helicase [Acinetobacter sp. BIGb0102]
MNQNNLALTHTEVLSVLKPIYLFETKTKIGTLSQLAIGSGEWGFDVTYSKERFLNLCHPTGISFQADLKAGIGKSKNSYEIIKGTISRTSNARSSFFDGVTLNGQGENGWKLRLAQLGATYSLLSHWSLSNDVATVVLPTGTGKTETMLITTLSDKANRTLVIVPTIDLKRQISDKFASWGILRELGVIPQDAPNPKVLVLNKILTSEEQLEILKEAEIVVSTPAFFARAKSGVANAAKDLFTHVYFDEAHHMGAAEWQELKKLFSNSKIVQFTATPYRNDRQPIEGKIVYNYSLSQALRDSCFSPISLVSVDEKHPKKKDKAIADAAMERLKSDRANGFNAHRIMVRAENRTKAEELFEDYQQWYPNERIVLVHSGITGRKKIIEDIRDHKYDIVVCVDMLKEGFDYPNFKIAAVHSVHKSLSVLLQFIGRFTRTQEKLGPASFVVNYAEEKMSQELENLFQEGSGWETVISEIADAKKTEAESLLTFLQGCQPYSGFDSPDIELNPKLVYPALSCVCYKCETVNWINFKNAFNLKQYALSQPYFNQQENVFYFTTQKRDKVKWAKTDKIRDQKWDLIILHFDKTNKNLYIGYSEKQLDVKELVEALTGNTATPLNGDCVFRSFDSIKRLSIVHAGIFKPANHLHRYSRLSGADVTTELTKWKNGSRCQKSDFVGIGFRNGFPVSVGASVKGKIWSPARVSDIKEWKSWCLSIGNLITDDSIDSNLLLENSASKTQLETYPINMIVLATDWSEELYDRMHKITIELADMKPYLLSECDLHFDQYIDNKADFTLKILETELNFSIILGGEKGHSIVGLDNCTFKLDGLKNTKISIKQFFEENPPTLFLSDGCTIAGCIHTNYGDLPLSQIPVDRIETFDWAGVDFTIESMYKSLAKREHSIQEYMMQYLVNKGATIVFNDDNSGESADIIAIFAKDNLIHFELIHCKYSKQDSGARLSDLYEVCGQAIVSLRYKWRPEELLKHLERRNGTGVLQGKRFYHGNSGDIDTIKKALKYTDVSFEFAIAQPGVKASSITLDMHNFLGSVYSTVVEMTETKLRCYFNQN